MSPWIQRLSRENILATGDASIAWDEIATVGKAPIPFPIHLWVAGREGTVCKWEGPDGIHDMKNRLPGEVIICL